MSRVGERLRINRPSNSEIDVRLPNTWDHHDANAFRDELTNLGLGIECGFSRMDNGFCTFALRSSEQILQRVARVLEFTFYSAVVTEVEAAPHTYIAISIHLLRLLDHSEEGRAFEVAHAIGAEAGWRFLESIRWKPWDALPARIKRDIHNRRGRTCG